MVLDTHISGAEFKIHVHVTDKDTNTQKGNKGSLLGGCYQGESRHFSRSVHLHGIKISFTWDWLRIEEMTSDRYSQLSLKTRSWYINYSQQQPSSKTVHLSWLGVEVMCLGPDLPVTWKISPLTRNHKENKRFNFPNASLENQASFSSEAAANFSSCLDCQIINVSSGECI